MAPDLTRAAEPHDLAIEDHALPDLSNDESADASDLSIDLRPPAPTWHYESGRANWRTIAGTGANDVYLGTGIAIDRSVDRGHTWKTLHDYQMHGTGPESLWVDGNTVVGVGADVKPVIIRSTNNGGIWSKPAQPDGLTFLNRMGGTGLRLYAACQVQNGGCVMLSGDAGATWSLVIGPDFPLDDPFAVWAVPRTTSAYVVGSNKRAFGIAFTDDGGQSWSDRSPMGAAMLFGAWGSDARDIYAVGGGGTILHARDGTTFTAEHSGVVETLMAVWGSGPQNVFAVGSDTVLRSTDRGTTWAKVPLPLPKGVIVNCRAVWGSSAADVYIVGEVRGGGGGFVLHWY